MQAFKEKGYYSVGMGKVFHPVKYEGKTDDIAGGSWSTSYCHAPGGEDTKLPLTQTNCGVAAAVASDEEYTDGMIAAHAVKSLQDVAKRSEPFFMGVGFHRSPNPGPHPDRHL